MMFQPPFGIFKSSLALKSVVHWIPKLSTLWKNHDVVYQTTVAAALESEDMQRWEDGRKPT